MEEYRLFAVELFLVEMFLLFVVVVWSDSTKNFQSLTKFIY